MGDGTASSAIADIGLRIIKEKEARIEELEAALKNAMVFARAHRHCGTLATSRAIFQEYEHAMAHAERVLANRQ